MNKVVFKWIVLLVVTGLLLVMLLKGRSPFGKSNSSFAAEPRKEITKIEFSDGGRRLVLEKEGDNWLLNGSTETRKSGIMFIQKVLQEIKIKSPVSDELFEKEIISKKIDPVKVKVFEKHKLLKSFLVYKTRSNIYGNIMKMREGSKPFIVYIPGYEGDIGSSFTLNELFWEPYNVFNLLPSEIASVTFENLSDTSASFSIISENHKYFLSDLNKNLTGWDTSLVSRYLSYFTWMPFESWEFDMGEKEKKEVGSEQPLYRISVGTTGNSKIILTLWKRKISSNDTVAIDSDRLLGKIQGRNDFFVMRYFDIDPLIKKRSYFYGE